MYFSRNIIILLILRAVRWFLLIMPVITIFYKENSLSMYDIFIIQACFSIAVILFEVPTGYFADVVGRKKSLVIGMVLGAIGIGTYAFSKGFWSFLIAELILGLGSSFISGTDSAMIYDVLIDEGKRGENKKIQGYMQTVSSISEGSASLFGGFLAVISISLPFYIQFGVYIAALPLLFFLEEPKRRRHDNKDGAIKGILKIVKYSLHEHKEIKWLIFFSGAFGASTLVMTWFLQSYFELVGVPLFYFGVLWTLFNLSLIPFSLSAHKLELFFGPKKSLIFISFFPILGYLGVGYFSTLSALTFVFFFYFARGFGGVVLNDYVNILASSEIRATILSVQALMLRFIFVLIGPFLGWISDIYSLQFALLCAGGIFSLIFLCFLTFFLGYNTKIL